MGLIIDHSSRGSGNSNCGNKARQFFSDIRQGSEITGVNEKTIEIFRNVIQMLASSREIPPLFFNEYDFRTAKLYVSLYPWYCMPSSAHKIQNTATWGKSYGEFYATNWHVFQRGFLGSKLVCQVYLTVQYTKDMSLAYYARPHSQIS